MIGFDAGDRDVVDRLIAAGDLPVIAGLFERGAMADMRNPIGLYSGPVWPTIATGTRPDQHRGWTWRPLVSGSYRMSYRGPNGEVARPTYWGELGRDGTRTVTIDVPNVAIQADVLGVQVIGWGQHDRWSTFDTSPEDLGVELLAKHPIDPQDRCDERGERGTIGELRVLRKEVLDSIEAKVELVRWLVKREQPEVLTVVFAEAHCTGHQFWHLHQREADREIGELAELGDVVREVYQTLDRAVAEVIAIGQGSSPADDPPAVVLILSHGIEQNISMPHLLDPVLRRIEAALGAPSAKVRARELARRAPNRLARLALRATHRPFEHLDHFLDGSRRFFPMPVFPAWGGVRLNLSGREPNGRIDPVDAEAMLTLLKTELRALRSVEGDEPMVRQVLRATDHYPEASEAGMFDLLFEWNVDCQVDAVWSPSLGTIRADRYEHREGGHRQDGRVVFAGGGIAPGRIPDVRAEDIGPTIVAISGGVLRDATGVPIPSVVAANAPSL